MKMTFQPQKEKNYQHKTKGRIKFMWSFLLSKAIQ